MKGKDAKAVSRIASARRRTGIASGIIITVSFIVAILLASYLIMKQNVKMSSENVKTMNEQLSKAAESKMEKLQSVCTRIYQRKSIVEYDASVYNHADSYGAMTIEKEISDFLMSMSTVDNYNDFFLVYANNHTVGKISKSASEDFGSEMYESLSGYLKNRSSLWFTGGSTEQKNMYYARRINSGAIFVGSMFVDAMRSVFPDGNAHHLSFVICDDNAEIIFSVNSSSIVSTAVSELKKQWQADEPVTVQNYRFAASSARCGDNWHVISISDFSDRNREYFKIFMYCAAILVSAVIVVFFVGFVFSSARDPGNLIYRGDYSTDSMDRLTGLIMNEALDNVIIGKLDSCINGSTMVLLLVMIKNYELISENYGVTAVDEAMIKVSAVLRDFYGKSSTVGKTGENEFAILADFTDFNLFKAHERMKANIRQLEEELDKLELENDRGMIRCALGAAVYPEDSEDYDELYSNARTALEDSTQTRACKCRFYKDMQPGKK